MGKGRYECKLSSEVVTKAHEELSEPLENAQRLQFIDELGETFKQRFPEQKLSEWEESDEFRLRFLRARKFNIERAAVMMNNYINRRETFPEVFELLDKPEETLSDYLDTRFHTVIEGHARNGSAVVLNRPTFGCPEPDMFKVFAAVFLAMERILEKEENQIHGITVINDLAYFNTHIVRQMNPSLAKKFMSMLQDTLPIRMKNLCVLNETTIFDVIFAIMKNFIRDKTRDRIVIIGSKWDLLHEKVDPRFLPEAYGGELKEEELNHAKWKSVLLGTSTAM